MSKQMKCLSMLCARHGPPVVSVCQTKPCSSINSSDVSQTLPLSSTVYDGHAVSITAESSTSDVWPCGDCVCPFHNLPTEW